MKSNDGVLFISLGKSCAAIITAFNVSEVKYGKFNGSRITRMSGCISINLVDSYEPAIRILLSFEAFEGFADDGLDGGHFIVGQLLKFALAPLAA